MFRFRYKQITPLGVLTSITQEVPKQSHVRFGVRAGHLPGEPRWAETPTGRFLYGVDAHGTEMAQAPV